jgi:phage gp36-like protein
MYCSADDIAAAITQDKLVQLTVDSGDSIDVDIEIVEAAIEEADELIDGFLRGRYTLPLDTPVVKLIKRLSVGIASYYLYQRRKGLDMPESLENKYKADIKILEHLQSGRITLGVETGTSTGAGEILTNKDSTSRVFTSDFLDTF